MLKAKDFTYFTKETLLQIIHNRSEKSVFEAFHIVKLLKRFYCLDTCSDASYEAILFNKMNEIKHLLPLDTIQLADLDNTLEDSQHINE